MDIVYVAMLEHRHGYDVFTASSAEALEDAILEEYVVPRWYEFYNALASEEIEDIEAEGNYDIQEPNQEAFFGEYQKHDYYLHWYGHVKINNPKRPADIRFSAWLDVHYPDWVRATWRFEPYMRERLIVDFLDLQIHLKDGSHVEIDSFAEKHEIHKAVDVLQLALEGHLELVKEVQDE